MQNLLLKARGLFTFPNILSEIPQGSLSETENVVIDRESVITSRRGFKVYGTPMAVIGDRAKQLAVYKTRILRHWASTLDFDSDGSGTFSSFPQSVTEIATGTKIKYQEANGNFYFTTDAGIKKISALTSADLLTANITSSGGIKALDGTVALDSSAGSGFFDEDSQVAYRIVWGFKDANGNLILGVPSERIIAVNSAQDLIIEDYNSLVLDLSTAAAADGGDTLSDVDYATLVIPTSSSAQTLLTALIFLAGKLDTDLTTLDFSAITAPSSPSDPATTLQLQAIQDYYDAIVNRLNTDPGISLTAFTSIGGAFSNSIRSINTTLTFTIPSDITITYFYQVYRSAQVTSDNASTPPNDELRLIFEANPTPTDITNKYIVYDDVVPDSFRDGGANLYTNANTGEGILQSNEPPPVAYDIALFRGFTFLCNTSTKHKKQFSLLGTTGLLTETLTITKNAIDLILTFSTVENALTQEVKVSTAATPAQQVDETARSLVRVINKQSSPLIYAYYISGPNDVPGLISLESTTTDSVPFYLTSSAGASDKFNPMLPLSGTSIVSDNEVSPNRLYYSKYQQPEAFPLLNYIDVGPKDSSILRIIPLRENLFIIKENEVYRLSGDTPTTFSVTLFDSGTSLVAPETAVNLNNQIYMLSDQGVVTISDTGVSAISRAIENDFLPLLSDDFTNFSTASFGVPYETDRAYLLWTLNNPNDTVPTKCYRYNIFTQTWTNWTSSKTAAVHNPATDKLYVGAGDINFIEIERKNFDRFDYADREYERTLPIDGINENILDLGSVFNIQTDDVLVQIQYLSIAQFNRLLTRLDTDNGVTDSDYVSSLSAVPGDNLRDSLTDLAIKLDADAGIATTTFSVAISGYGTDFIDEQDAFNTIVVMLNLDVNTTIKNYKTSTGTVQWEVPVADVTTTSIVLAYAQPFISGIFTQYKRIVSYVIWSPIIFGDVSSTKQVSEGTIIFENMNFTTAEAAYASDLSPNFEPIPFTGEGTGVWGNFNWGNVLFGGDATSRPFRTYVPKSKQRCRYIQCKFTHSGAFEKYSIFGISLTYNNTSQRGYR